MKLVVDTGLWRTDTEAEAAPLAAVLEVSGAVLAWTVDDPDPSAPPALTFTDPARADWLWRVTGERGHVELLSALEDGPDRAVEVADLQLLAAPLAPLRKLALGHWLRRWWPASRRDGIALLDAALLDAEIAVLTAAAEAFFTDDTLDSDVAELLAPHTAALASHARSGDSRVRALAQAALELGEQNGIDAPDLVDTGRGRREDYALAAGGGSRSGALVIADGVDSVRWAGVPASTFDAAEDTVDWSIEVADAAVVAAVRVALTGSGDPAGIAVGLVSAAVNATGVLDSSGTARLPVFDSGDRPLTEAVAWNHDWSTTAVTVGVPVGESAQTRARLRAFARARLTTTTADAFLAEVLAADSLY